MTYLFAQTVRAEKTHCAQNGFFTKLQDYISIAYKLMEAFCKHRKKNQIAKFFCCMTFNDKIKRKQMNNLFQILVLYIIIMFYSLLLHKMHVITKFNKEFIFLTRAKYFLFT